MTNNEKDLLLKDLCLRLPYNVKVEAKGLLKTIENDYNDRNIINAHVLNGLNLGNHFKTYSINSIANIPLFNRNGVCNIKPYLFPLDSMTEEQKNEYNRLKHEVSVCHYEYGDIVEEVELFDSQESFEYLIKNHFDIHGLIPMGLAINAVGKNIY